MGSRRMAQYICELCRRAIRAYDGEEMFYTEPDRRSPEIKLYWCKDCAGGQKTLLGKRVWRHPSFV